MARIKGKGFVFLILALLVTALLSGSSMFVGFSAPRPLVWIGVIAVIVALIVARPHARQLPFGSLELHVGWKLLLGTPLFYGLWSSIPYMSLQISPRAAIALQRVLLLIIAVSTAATVLRWRNHPHGQTRAPSG